MKIIPYDFSIGELVEDYNVNKETDAVTAFNGRLDIRPPYQREFVYDNPEKKKVIESVLCRRPLNIFYLRLLAENEERIVETATGYGLYDGDKLLLTANSDNSNVVISDGAKFGLADGQQRLLSICTFIKGEFSLDWRGTKNCTFESPSIDKDLLLSTKLTTFICFGTLDELLDWFETINLAGKPLTKQEIRNSACTGKWLVDAKKFFSKPRVNANSEAYKLFIKGKANNQDVLEKVLSWAADAEGYYQKGEDNIKRYMSAHFKQDDANDLIAYFKDVTSWFKYLFVGNDDKNRREKVMQSVNWGILYNKYKRKQNLASPSKMQELVTKLMNDREVSNKTGIYEYVLTCDENGENGDESLLNLRTFNDDERQEKWYEQGRTCPDCGVYFDWSKMEAHHDIPWRDGGKTDITNLVMLCPDCHRERTRKYAEERKLRRNR